MLKRIAFWIFALSVASLWVASQAPAAPFEAAYHINGGGEVVIPVDTVSDPGNGIINAFSVSNADFEFTVNAFLGPGETSPNPMVIYAISVEDFSPATDFGFRFEFDIGPIGAPNDVRATNASSTTNGTGAGVPITYIAPPNGPEDGSLDEIFVFTLSTNGGTSFVSAGVDLREAFSGNSTSDIQTALDTGLIAGPASGSYDRLRLEINFGMDGTGDTYTFDGRFEIVPEPGTALLLAAGLSGLGLLRRRC